jgi:hypothetical protein
MSSESENKQPMTLFNKHTVEARGSIVCYWHVKDAAAVKGKSVHGCLLRLKQYDASFASLAEKLNKQHASQVEVKLRLAGKEAHDKLVDLLSSSEPTVYRQRNCFYDGPNKELSSQMTVLRVRWFNTNEKVVVTVKGKMAVVDGIGRAQEDEDEVSVDIAQSFEDNPSTILDVDLPVIKSLRSYGPLGAFPHALALCSCQMLEARSRSHRTSRFTHLPCMNAHPISSMSCNRPL